jgi:hypothetical protein
MPLGFSIVENTSTDGSLEKWWLDGGAIGNKELFGFIIYLLILTKEIKNKSYDKKEIISFLFLPCLMLSCGGSTERKARFLSLA